MKSKAITDVNFSAVTRESNEINYRNNIDNIRYGKPYRVFYLVDKELTDPKLEHIVIVFDSEHTINYVNIETCNCLATDLQVMLSDGTLKDYTVRKNAYGENVLAKGIRFYLNTENYRPKEYEVDTTRMDKYFYNIIEADVYSQVNTGQELFNIEKVNGINKYNEDLAAYNAAILKYDSLTPLVESIFGSGNYVVLTEDGQQVSPDEFIQVQINYSSSNSSTTEYNGRLIQKQKYGLLSGSD